MSFTITYVSSPEADMCPFNLNPIQCECLGSGSHKWKPSERWWWLCVNMPEPSSFLGMEEILMCRKPRTNSSTDLHWVFTWFWSTWKMYANYQYPSGLHVRDIENLTMEEAWELGKCNSSPFVIKMNMGTFALKVPEILMYTQRVTITNSTSCGLQILQMVERKTVLWPGIQRWDTLSLMGSGINFFSLGFNLQCSWHCTSIHCSEKPWQAHHILISWYT